MAYRQTQRVAERLADRRAAILAAARSLVAEEGWSAATISNVAERAGIATGTVYRYWASKADLCVEVVATVSAHEVAVLRDIAALDDPPAEKLQSAVRTFLRRALRGRRLAYALIAEPCDPEVEEVRLKYRAELAGAIASILRQGADSGDFDVDDCTVAASCIVGAFMEALVGPLLPRGTQAHAEDDRLVRKTCAFCTRTVAVSLAET